MRTQFLAKKSEAQKNCGHRVFWLLLLVVGLCPLSTLAQCDTSWTGGASGNWSAAGNWSAGVPTTSTNACISTANSTVTLNIIGASTTDLTLGSTDTLSFGNETQLTVNGNTISNSGTISLNSTGVPTELVMGTLNVTLSGTGTIDMSNNANNYITGSAPSNMLTNQSTIQGSGNIGIGQMALNNSGTIDANQSTALILQISNGATNTGMLQATSGGTLEIAGGTYNNTGGTIQAGPGSTVQIRSNATINGGTLTQSSGTLEFSNATINAEILNPANGGQVVIDNSTGLTLGAGSSIINAGTISMNSTGLPTDLIIAAPNVTLSGSGTLTMSNSQYNFIEGSSSSTFTNQSTIQGAGTIGIGGLVLINSGTIDANQSTALQLQMANGATNTGTLEAADGGTLFLFDGTLTNTGGIILADAGSTVQFNGSVTVNGGTITQTGGTLEFRSGTSNTTIDAEILNFANAGQVEIDNGAFVVLGPGSSVINAGTITMDSIGSNTDLIIGATNVTLSGAGTLTMSNNIGNVIEGSAASNTFTNQSTIQGSGDIGSGHMALNNSGTIDANQTVALSLWISNGATNTGTLEATNGATLMVLGGTYTNSGAGTFLATGTNSQVVLDGTTVNGGTLTSSAGGQIVAEFFSTLNGVTISNGTTVNLADGQVLNLAAGTITNNGTINLESSGDSTELAINGVTTLAGTGSVTMTANTNNLILGGGTLNNQETIQGAGNIGEAGLILNNSGTINANQSAALTIQIANGATNLGTLEATNGGTLVLLGGTYNNTRGTIQAGAGSTVQFSNGVTINGGTVTQTGGILEFQSGITTTINGEILNPANGGQAEIDNGASLTLGAGSSINNAGTMTMNSTGSQTYLIIDAPNVTLSGTGTFTMSNNANNYITGLSAANMLTNQSTIQGAGDIGLGSMALNNSGTIDANQSAGLILQIGNGATNTGTLEASNGATLTFAGGTYANTGGMILNDASTIVFNGGVTINGGTVTQTGAGTIQLSNATINTALGNSSTSTIEVIGGTDNTVAGALNNPSGGQVKIDDGGELLLGAGSSISNAGIIAMNSSGDETELIIGANVTLSGTGSLTMSNNIGNSILGAVESDTLTNQSTIQGAGNIGNGQMALNNSGTIDANQSASLTLQISNGATNTGLLEATSGATLILAGGTYTNTGAGTILATGTGSTVVLSGATIIGGTLTSSSGGQFVAEFGPTLNGVTVSSGTTVNLTDGQVLNLAGTMTNKGTINIESSGDSTQLAINGNVTLAGTGSVILSDNANNFILGSGTLTNQSTIEGEGNIGDGEIGLVNTGSILANEKTASTLFIDTSAAGFSNSSGTKNGVLNVGAKNTVIIEGGPFNNFSGGTLTGGTYIVAGTLAFNAAGVGVVTNQAAITISGAKASIIDTSDSANALTSFANNGTNGSFTVSGVTFNDANVFTNSGTLAAAAGGKFNVSTQLTNFNGTTSTLTGGNYNLTATGQLQFNNMGDSSDIVTNDANITLAGADTTKSSIIDQTGANALANFATNGSTGSFTLTTDRNFTTGGPLTNAGIVDVQKSTGTGTTKLIVNGSYTQTGGTTTVDGVLSTSTGLNVSGGFIYGSGAGIINGTQGTLVGNFNLTGGTISPGDGIKKIGDLNITGTYNESGAGILNIDLDGTTPNTKYDVLNISGAATLGGTLDVDTLTGFSLAAGDSFDILNYASETGTFTTVNLPTLTGGETWNVSYNATDLVITVEAPAVSNGTVSATPAHRVSRTFESSTAGTHEPTAILSRAACFAARIIGSASCGDKTSVVTASHAGDIHEVASVHTDLNSVHNNVTRSISSGRGGASHETSGSASAMARLYACAYLPSTVDHAMGCN